MSAVLPFGAKSIQSGAGKMKKAIAISIDKTNFGPVFFSGDICSAVIKAKEYGYDGVELSVRNPDSLNIRLILDALEATCLPVVTIATGQSYLHDGLCLYSEDKDVVGSCIERVKKCIDLACILQSPYITIGGIRGKCADMDKRMDAADNLTHAIVQCATYGEKKNVGLLIEPVNHFEVGAIFTIRQAMELIDKIGSKSIKVLYDTYHVNIEENSRIAPLYEAGEQLGHVHFADNNRLVPGCGFFDFTEVVRVLKQTQYEGYICIEALPFPNDDFAAKKASAYLDVLLSSEKRMSSK